MFALLSLPNKLVGSLVSTNAEQNSPKAVFKLISCDAVLRLNGFE